MSYILEYRENGQSKKQYFNSYYECIKEKKQLQKRGIENINLKDDVIPKVYVGSPKVMRNNSKEAIKRFVEMCKDSKAIFRKQS